MFNAAALGVLAYTSSKIPQISPRVPVLGLRALNFAFHAFFTVGFVVNQGAYGFFEPIHVNNSETIDKLSKKYNFGIYDFAQAKKESQLKAFRDALVADVLIPVQY